jgi:hypothetical protein
MQGPQYTERNHARIIAEARALRAQYLVDMSAAGWRQAARAIERLFAAIERFLVASMREPPPRRRGQGNAGDARRRLAAQGVGR